MSVDERQMGGHVGGLVKFDLAQWSGAQNLDQFPQNTPPDPNLPGATPTETSLNAFTNAANLGDPPLDAQHQLDYQNRQLKYDDAQNKFPANEENAAQQMQGVEQQSDSQMAQMIPQLVSGIGSALGGLISPLAQLPQQLMQAGTQAMQQGMSAMQSAGGEPLTDEQLLGDEGFTDPLADDPGADTGGSPGGSAGGSDTETAPSALSAPPAAATFPSSAPALKGAVASTSATPHTGMTGGMTGMPMMPHGAMAGANGQQKDDKPDTKRVAAPSIKNGAPVQGRLTTPAVPPVTKLVQGKPVATRRSATTDTATEEAKVNEPRPAGS